MGSLDDSKETPSFPEETFGAFAETPTSVRESLNDHHPPHPSKDRTLLSSDPVTGGASVASEDVVRDIPSGTVGNTPSDEVGDAPSNEVSHTPRDHAGVHFLGDVGADSCGDVEGSSNGDVGTNPQGNISDGPLVDTGYHIGSQDLPFSARAASPVREGAVAADAAVEQHKSGVCLHSGCSGLNHARLAQVLFCLVFGL